MRAAIDAFTSQIGEVIVGKSEAGKLAVACLLARDHLLIEDIPGVGKTTLSQALARSPANFCRAPSPRSRRRTRSRSAHAFAADVRAFTLRSTIR